MSLSRGILVRISLDKLSLGKQIILHWEVKIEATSTEIQQIPGLRHHFSGCIRPGRLFVSWMLQDLRLAYRTAPNIVTAAKKF